MLERRSRRDLLDGRRRDAVRPAAHAGHRLPDPSMRADAGVVISASHNPYQDNGIKFFSRDGFKLPDEVERGSRSWCSRPARSGDGGRSTPCADREPDRQGDADRRRGRPLHRVPQGALPAGADARRATIVVDCAHGAAYKVAPAVFEELGAEVITLNAKPDGKNINDECGALHPEVDGEGDREAPRGHRDRPRRRRRPGDRRRREGRRSSTATPSWRSSARDLHARSGRSRRTTVVATVMSNIGPGALARARWAAAGAHPGRRPLRRRGDACATATTSAASSRGT